MMLESYGCGVESSTSSGRSRPLLIADCKKGINDWLFSFFVKSAPCRAWTHEQLEQKKKKYIYYGLITVKKYVGVWDVSEDSYTPSASNDAHPYYYSSVTVLLQCCYSAVTVLLQCCYSVVTVWLCSYGVDTELLQCCYIGVAVCYTPVSPPHHPPQTDAHPWAGYTAHTYSGDTEVTQRCYSGGIVVSQWCYSSVTVVLQWCGVTVVLPWSNLAVTLVL
jgi:hypothetical protein